MTSFLPARTNATRLFAASMKPRYLSAVVSYRVASLRHLSFEKQRSTTAHCPDHGTIGSPLHYRDYMEIGG